MPVSGVVCLVLALLFVCLTIIAPGLSKIIPGGLLIASLVGAVVSFVFRDELPFLFVILRGRIEKGRVTTETRSRL